MGGMCSLDGRRAAEGGDFGESGCFGNLPTPSPRGGPKRGVGSEEGDAVKGTTETGPSATAAHRARFLDRSRLWDNRTLHVARSWLGASKI
jgi:hypothetical protein